MAVTVDANFFSGFITITSPAGVVTIGLPEFRAIARWVSQKDAEPHILLDGMTVTFEGPDGIKYGAHGREP